MKAKYIKFTVARVIYEGFLWAYISRDIFFLVFLSAIRRKKNKKIHMTIYLYVYIHNK